MPVIRKLTRFGGTLTLSMPPEVRRHLNVNRGDYLVWLVDKAGFVVVEKLTPKKHPGYFIPGSGFLIHGEQK